MQKQHADWATGKANLFNFCDRSDECDDDNNINDDDQGFVWHPEDAAMAFENRKKKVYS